LGVIVKRLSVCTAATVSVLAAVVPASAASAAPTPVDTPQARLDVYTGVIARDRLKSLVELGIDRHELRVSAAGEGAKAGVRVETILTGRQAAALRRSGLALRLKRIGGTSVARRATKQVGGLTVFRRYSGPGGIKEEFEQVAAAHPRIAKLVSIGQSVNGKDIVALKVSENAATLGDGRKPAVLYLGAQHAREWITPEMVRRLMHHFVDGYGSDATITRLLRENELWFLPVANPDGYDWTFEPGQRLWRKNLRDNNGDGRIAAGDGVDLNRNFPTRWGYDNEGSSPAPSSETYRGPAPASEPETQALDALARRVGFEFLVNYHSAAELLLYGTGWQVSTPGPDDVLYEAMAGDDAAPAVPGYDPDISAELYTTNGDTDTHITESYGTLGFTPEMSTCAAASAANPDDQWEPDACGSVFEFPDDEALIQAEFEKNIPFALSVAESASDPENPVSVVGRAAEDFRVDSFDVSYGASQTVAVVAKRSLRKVRLNYRIDGGRTRRASVSEWRGGERYGDENNVIYAELRGRVRGTEPGDRVEVWFTARKRGVGRVESSRFTYTAARDTEARVLVIANEDYTGVNPTYPPGTNAPRYADAHVAALRAAGYDADVWDVDAQGVPHDLGVLSHYDAVLWYLGDNRITQDPEDELIATPFGELPDIGVAERQQYLTMAVRDFLNEGGKLVHAGETAQYSGLAGVGDAVGGLYYAINGDPTAECVITASFFDDCLLLADDFRQYYLGGFARVDVPDPASVTGIAEPLAGFEAALGGPVVEGDNPLDEAGAFQPTSEVLPPDRFPQFASAGVARYPETSGGGPFAPVEGERYAGLLHADATYARLTTTVDLTGAASAQLRFALSINTEPGYDSVIVEARTAGVEDWTTLPDLEGGTTTAPPPECTDQGFLLEMHPFLRHYLGGEPCTGAGTSGTWNAFTASTDGWQTVAVDLAPFLGGPVELSISYVTDPASGGVGAFVDDTHVLVNDAVVAADGFEGETSIWTPGGPPAGSPPNATNWQIGGRLLNFYAGTATADTLLLGFGLEQLATDADRVELVGRALGGLLGRQ